ncbi:MAG: hypothetical protein JWR26_2560 [Pedosphaera sp.]|nr:hypothetical protein [Pedosphaera sp.]
MKEDILEQLVDDYLQSEGYFTRHNIKFRPRPDHPEFVKKKDSNHSDIDVIGINPMKSGPDGVWVVSCKSWQAGFRVTAKLKELTQNKIISGKEAWQFFRELMKPKWSRAFIDAVEAATGTRTFTYVLAVTAIIGERQHWEKHPPFVEALDGNPIRMIDLTEMIDHIQKMSTTTVASSDIGRVLQLMKAAKKGQKALIEAVESHV